MLPALSQLYVPRFWSKTLHAPGRGCHFKQSGEGRDLLHKLHRHHKSISHMLLLAFLMDWRTDESALCRQGRPTQQITYRFLYLSTNHTGWDVGVIGWPKHRAYGLKSFPVFGCIPAFVSVYGMSYNNNLKDVTTHSFAVSIRNRMNSISGKWPTWRTISSIICLFESSICFEKPCAHPQEDNCINTTSGIITLC